MPNYQGIWKLSEQYQAASGWPEGPLTGTTALFAGGDNTSGTEINSVEYITVATSGSSTDFGDMTKNSHNLAGCGSSTRSILFGGSNGGNVIQYVQIAFPANFSDFGDLQFGTSYNAALSNETRGITNATATSSNNLEYITIATTGNSTTFGQLLGSAETFGNAGCSSTTRGLFAGGYRSGAPSGNNNAIDYITIATTGNASDFGDMTLARFYLAAASSNTRALFAGGYQNYSGPFNTIDYVTIASTGNATDFGDLTSVGMGISGTSSSTIAVFGSRQVTANTPSSANNTVDYVTIASAGNASDFGDLAINRSFYATCSNGHGGLA